MYLIPDKVRRSYEGSAAQDRRTQRPERAPG
jgi:hypothetical protein